MRIRRKAFSFDRDGYVPTEHEEQAQLIRMVNAAFPRDVAALLWAIPNGGGRHIKTAVDLKREGVRAGVPDLMFAYPHKGYAGLFIEMKRRKGGRISEEQKRYIELLRAQSYAVVVCKGCDEAFRAITSYLGRDAA
ncbi:VRR-NUC domain-containing protein [Cloacibacillus sp. An23]|uniref:VRR-NUC domain-containing protein n=1 Tax=Cloacibacillus sp. An23 TaxID=1965591 RepID=UPI000B372279|nr:VRR-NUC domain-containing protein [Cloacibacillus sp. An23]OUO94787.1 hypothetical protein B5F39_02650 [Cloacibacillus sp. An23]